MKHKFAATPDEYQQLMKQFGQLTHFAAWSLLRKNSRSDPTDEQDDIAQELQIALLDAARYYKRQTYIITCLKLAAEHVQDGFVKELVAELQALWENRKKHGSYRQKFGAAQERLLDDITARYVPEALRPDPDSPLVMDATFLNYCKCIVWNRQKGIGVKMTRELAIRKNMVSLSEFEYLGADAREVI